GSNVEKVKDFYEKNQIGLGLFAVALLSRLEDSNDMSNDDQVENGDQVEAFGVGIAKALAAHDADRNTNGNDSHVSGTDKQNYLEHHIPDVPVAPPGQQVPPQALAAHVAWVKGQKEELKAMYSKQAEPELLQIVREFHTSKQEEGQSVSSHVLKMKGYIDNLKQLSQPVRKNIATVNELHAMLKLHEEMLPNKDANPALHTPPPPKKDNPAKDAICHQCGEVGHWKRNRHVYLAELMKKKKLSQGDSTLGSTGK
nr:hypothetical protein [Tanacetum cinerariifolium]